jgi:hypothetical protein
MLDRKRGARAADIPASLAFDQGCDPGRNVPVDVKNKTARRHDAGRYQSSTTDRDNPIGHASWRFAAACLPRSVTTS